VAFPARFRSVGGRETVDFNDLPDNGVKVFKINPGICYKARSEPVGRPVFVIFRLAREPHARGAPGPYRSLLKGDDRTVEVSVRDNDVDQALRALKKKMQREGIFREMKMRRSYEKPSERRAREKAEAIRRARKLERKRMEREGF
jgi:small subunit ribosomal protein S21